MKRPSSDLPVPSRDAAEISHALTARIVAEIEQRAGFMPFDRYMELVLYEPGLGYYANPGVKFGASGDFVTAAGLGDWLAAALADLVAAGLGRLGTSIVVEVGAGTGQMAEAVVTRLAERGHAGVKYMIVETSAELRRRQQRRLARFGHRVEWLDRLPERRLEAIVVANEVVDAFPVERFTKRAGHAVPVGVTCAGGSLAWSRGPSDARLADAVERLEAALGRALPDGYTSEICGRLPAWLAGLSAMLARGGVVLIDYGLVRREYYHEQRDAGTLICHYRHRAHADPFAYPGLQDVSAWVDFSACADAAARAGFSVAGFTPQAQFLLDSIERAAAARPPRGAVVEPSPAAASALKTLVLPGEMGERFKLLWLTKSLDGVALPGRDLRDRL